MTNLFRNHHAFIILALTALLMQGAALGHASADRKTVDEAYPGLATGVLKSARLTELETDLAK